MTVTNALVDFYIEELVEETKVTVKESSFASFPPEIAEERVNDNDGSWD